MKIGILTFHRAENFGAVLQCYALQEYLQKKYGHTTEVIDYRCKAIEKAYYVCNLRILVSRLNVIASINGYFKQLKFFRDKIRKKQQYRLFRKRYLHLSKPVCRPDRVTGYDVYITGSDQVWNPTLTGGFDVAYFLSSQGMNVSRKISYAASTDSKGMLKLEKYHHALSQSLTHIDFISVREKAFASFLSKFTAKEITVCCDPTFLLSKDDYLSLAVQPKESNYVLVYHVAESEEASHIADMLAAKKGVKVIEVHASFDKRKDRQRHRQNLGPSEILGLIAYADSVVTTSFHGIALSLIMEKQLFVISQKNNVRQNSILQMLDLEDRIIKDGILHSLPSIDYKKVKSKIEMMALSSKMYLNQSLTS